MAIQNQKNSGNNVTSQNFWRLWPTDQPSLYPEFYTWHPLGIQSDSDIGVTLLTVYADSQTKETFKTIFTEFHEAINRVTGQPLQYIALEPNNPAATFAVWQLDAETAQWWGLGAYLKTRNNPKIHGIDTEDEYEIVLHAAKTCQAHFSW